MNKFSQYRLDRRVPSKIAEYTVGPMYNGQLRQLKVFNYQLSTLPAHNVEKVNGFERISRVVQAEAGGLDPGILDPACAGCDAPESR